MSEFKRIKKKVTKRHYTGILKGEATYLLTTVERLVGALKETDNDGILMDLDLWDTELKTEDLNAIENTASNLEGYRFLPEKF